MITFPEISIDMINIVIILFYVVLIISGARNGFLRTITATVGTLLSFLGSWRYSGVMAEIFPVWPKALTPFAGTLVAESVYLLLNTVVWFIILFAAIRLMFMILEKMIAGLQHMPVIKQLSMFLGAVLGAVNATLWALVINMLLLTPLFSNGAEIARNSYLSDISRESTVFLSQAGISADFSEIVNKIYLESKELDDSDQVALKEWLESHGFENNTEE